MVPVRQKKAYETMAIYPKYMSIGTVLVMSSLV